MSKKSTRREYMKELRKLLSGSTAPLNLAPTSQPQPDNEKIEYSVEEIEQEKTTEDSPTNTQLPPYQIIDGCVFYLPIEYKGSKILGAGAHGVVAAATTSSGDKQIAVKKIKLNIGPLCDDVKDLYLWKSCYRELSILIHLKENGAHPNVIALMDALLISISKTEYELMFLTNLMKTSLENLMESTTLTNREKKWYIYQILCGLAYLHSKNIIHRDLKSGNVLVNGDELCVADFGQSRVYQVSDDLSLLICDDAKAPGPPLTIDGIGSFIYRAPELHFRCANYSYPADMWSVGCILAEMYLKSRKTLFTGGQLGDHLGCWIKEVFRLIGTPTSPEDIDWPPILYAPYLRALCSAEPLEPNWSVLSTDDEAALDLIKNLLVFNPSKRITVQDALQHRYFEGMALPNLPEMAQSSASSSFISELNVDQFETIEQVRDAMYNLIKHMQQNH